MEDFFKNGEPEGNMKKNRYLGRNDRGIFRKEENVWRGPRWFLGNKYQSAGLGLSQSRK